VGLAAPGLAAPGLAAPGLAALGVAALGLAALGVAAPGPWSRRAGTAGAGTAGQADCVSRETLWPIDAASRSTSVSDVSNAVIHRTMQRSSSDSDQIWQFHSR
jgi:hypothetical protein